MPELRRFVAGPRSPAVTFLAGFQKPQSMAELSQDCLSSLQTHSQSTFADVQKAPPDPMFDLKQRYDRDSTTTKIDLGAGVYRNEAGEYHEFPVIQKVTMSLTQFLHST